MRWATPRVVEALRTCATAVPNLLELGGQNGGDKSTKVCRTCQRGTVLLQQQAHLGIVEHLHRDAIAEPLAHNVETVCLRVGVDAHGRGGALALPVDEVAQPLLLQLPILPL